MNECDKFSIVDQNLSVIPILIQVGVVDDGSTQEGANPTIIDTYAFSHTYTYDTTIIDTYGSRKVLTQVNFC